AGEQLVGAYEGVALGEPLQAPEQPQVLAAGQPVVERRLLPGQRQLGTRGGGPAHDVVAGDERAPRAGERERGEDADRRRLTRPVVAGRAEQGPRLDAEIQAGKRFGVAEALAQSLVSYSVRHRTAYGSGTLYGMSNEPLPPIWARPEPRGRGQRP